MVEKRWGWITNLNEIIIEAVQVRKSVQNRQEQQVDLLQKWGGWQNDVVEMWDGCRLELCIRL